MGETSNMRGQGGKPSGFLGRAIGRMMNVMHSGAYKWGLKAAKARDNIGVLDIGCGGGRLLSNMSRQFDLVCGIDHSEEMANMADRLNRRNQNVEVRLAPVDSIPYSDGFFGLVTAFETVQHWPDIASAFSEVKRVLEPMGIFLIVNRYPEEGSKWMEYLKLKNEGEYRRALKEAGFDDIKVDLSRKGWICVRAIAAKEV